MQHSLLSPMAVNADGVKYCKKIQKEETEALHWPPKCLQWPGRNLSPEAPPCTASTIEANPLILHQPYHTGYSSSAAEAALTDFYWDWEGWICRDTKYTLNHSEKSLLSSSLHFLPHSLSHSLTGSFSLQGPFNFSFICSRKSWLNHSSCLKFSGGGKQATSSIFSSPFILLWQRFDLAHKSLLTSPCGTHLACQKARKPPAWANLKHVNL